MEVKNEFQGSLVKFVFHVGELKAGSDEEVFVEDVMSKTQEFSKGSRELENKTSEKLRPIEVLETFKPTKERNGCTRLCSTERCIVY